MHIDYTIIKNLLTKPITNGIVTRWLLLLQEFDISVMDRLGKNNLVADFISRIISTNKSLHVDDAFPYEHLFSISTNVP